MDKLKTDTHILFYINVEITTNISIVEDQIKENAYRSLIILCCSLFHRSLKSEQNPDQRLKKSLGATEESPDFGTTVKKIQHCSYL